MVRPDLFEAALAHKEAGRVRAAYNRAGFAAERRKMLQAWGDYCLKTVKQAREAITTEKS